MESKEEREREKAKELKKEGLVKVVCDLAPLDLVKDSMYLEKPCHLIYQAGSLPECELKAYRDCRLKYGVKK